MTQISTKIASLRNDKGSYEQIKEKCKGEISAIEGRLTADRAKLSEMQAALIKQKQEIGEKSKSAKFDLA